MPDQTKLRRLTWTVLPSGRIRPVGGTPMAVAGVLVTPRLLGPAEPALTLEDYGIQLWPQRLAALRLDVLRAGVPLAGVVRIPHVTLDGAELAFSLEEQAAIWQAVFPAGTLVRPWQAQSYADRDTREFPASKAGAQIGDAYGATTRALVDAASRRDGAAEDRHAALARVSAMWRSSARAVDSPLRQAYDFYRRSPADVRQEMAQPPLDFHDIVARLADHPILLRALGLLVDVAIPAAELAGDDAATLSVAAVWPSPDAAAQPGWAAIEHQDLAPATAYALAGSRFLAAADGPDGAAVDGQLPLAGAGTGGPGGNPRFEIMPFDVDGAALRVVNVADGGPDPDVPEEGSGLPALRSVGFALIDRERGEDHRRRLRRADARARADGLLGAALTSANLTAGYRLDVFDKAGGRWHALCARRVRYRIGNIAIAGGAAIADEGSVRQGSATTGATPGDALYLHQTIARWDGWSLAVPRPERVLADTDPLDVTEDTAPPFVAQVEAEPGSLPLLRFGRTYALRARLADLAGGGLRQREVGDGEQCTAQFVHCRFEPILAPVLATTRAHRDGDGGAVMVIRSDRGVTAGAYAAAHGYRDVDQRHLLPPAVSLELAMKYERDGGFNAALGADAPDTEVRRLFATATRADRDLGDVPDAETQTGADGLGSYVVLPERAVDTPWLCDPAGWAIRLRVRSRPIDPATGHAGASTGLESAFFKWRGAWPDLVPIQLVLKEAQRGCALTSEMQGDRQVLAVALGPAEQAVIDIVSCPSHREIGWLGIALWGGADPAHTSDPVSLAVTRGENSLITPPRTITLVHAVQRPLIGPSGMLRAVRAMGETRAELKTDALRFDVRSTGRLQLDAIWQELEDRPGAPPRSREFAAAVGAFDVRHVVPDRALPKILQDFTDTRRRRVNYRVTAVSRFSDYFGTLLAADADACTRVAKLAVTDVPSAAHPPAPVLRHVMPSARWDRVDTVSPLRSSRRGGRLRVFLERPWFVSGEDEGLAVLAAPSPLPLGSSASASLLRRCVSLAGRDPIRETTSPTELLVAGNFIGAALQREVLLTREGVRIDVDALVYPVQFDAELDCWFADIDLATLAGSFYFPFVRLGLARHQAHTVDPEQRLSPPILAEPVQLLPNRDLTVRFEPGRARVVLGGVGPGGAAVNTVAIELQAYDGVPDAADDALIGAGGWTRIARHTGFLDSETTLEIPTAADRRLRILVTEDEAHPAPASDAAPTARLVYSDIVEVPQ